MRRAGHEASGVTASILIAAVMACLLLWTGARGQERPEPSTAAGAAATPHVVPEGGGRPTDKNTAVRATDPIDADELHPAWSGAFALAGGYWTSAAPGDARADDQRFASGFE